MIDFAKVAAKDRTCRELDRLHSGGHRRTLPLDPAFHDARLFAAGATPYCIDHSGGHDRGGERDCDHRPRPERITGGGEREVRGRKAYLRVHFPKINPFLQEQGAAVWVQTVQSPPSLTSCGGQGRGCFSSFLGRVVLLFFEP